MWRIIVIHPPIGIGRTDTIATPGAKQLCFHETDGQLAA